MRVTWHAPITAGDGLVLRADVFRPVGDAPVPVILSYGIYGKGLSFQEAYAYQWNKMVGDYPEILAKTSAKYMNWETTDPEWWVPNGYAVVRVDSRGAGWTPGPMDPESPRETQDIYECIEWAARQPWCTGKVGLLGISYFAFNQWRAAALKPPHLAAMVPWEGRLDAYRDALFHGGIWCDFKSKWFGLQVLAIQYGNGERGPKNPNTGEPVAGPVTLSAEELARNRVDRLAEWKAHPFDDAFHASMNPDPALIEVPLLSAANWGGQGLHLRGNIEGFAGASGPKWLEVHGDAHWVHFYTDYGLDLQRRFFDHFLKGEANGWEKQPQVQLTIRHWDGQFTQRTETEWPIARTQWTKLYLNAADGSLGTEAPATEASVRYLPAEQGVTFALPALERDTEITGPIAARLFISSETTDADLFLTVRAFNPQGGEITFQGALDPHTPIGNGWLRASHRKLDPGRSTPYRPFHPHDAAEPLVPGTVYEVDVEIWPTCIALGPGCRFALTVAGRDYEYDGDLGSSGFVYAGKGVGPFTHTDPVMRPPAIYNGAVTLHTGPQHRAHVLLPVVPRR